MALSFLPRVCAPCVFGLADGGIGADMDALQLEVAVLEVVQHAVGQAVVGDAVPHDAADLVAGVEDGDIVTPACQQDGDGQARRPRADDRLWERPSGKRSPGRAITASG